MGVVVDVGVEMGCVGICGQVCVMGKTIGLIHIIMYTFEYGLQTNSSFLNRSTLLQWTCGL